MIYPPPFFPACEQRKPTDLTPYLASRDIVLSLCSCRSVLAQSGSPTSWQVVRAVVVAMNPAFAPTTARSAPRSPHRIHPAGLPSHCCRRCRRRAPKLFEDSVLAITHPLPPRASSACAPAGRLPCRSPASVGLAYAGLLVQAQPRGTVPREQGVRQAPPSLQ